MAQQLKKVCLRCRRRRRHGFDPWVGKIPWRRAWQPTPVSLPGESHGQRSQAGYSPWGCKESDTTEAAKHAHAGVTCISSPLAPKPVDRRTRGWPSVTGVTAALAADTVGGDGLVDLFAPCSKAKFRFGGKHASFISILLF